MAEHTTVFYEQGVEFRDLRYLVRINGVRTEINEPSWRIFEVASGLGSDIARTKDSVYTSKHVVGCPFGVKNFQMAAQVRVGVGVFVFNAAGAFIMGKRKGSHGAGTSIKSIHAHFCYYTGFLHTV